MSAIPTTKDHDAARGPSSPSGRTDEPTPSGDTSGGGSTDVTEATLDAAAGEDELVQGGEAPGIDTPSSGHPNPAGRHQPMAGG